MGATPNPYFIESLKDGKRITYVESNGTIITKGKTLKAKYKQSIVSSDTGEGDNNYKLFVFEVNANGLRFEMEDSKFLDFNQHARDAVLIASEPSTGPSQKWDLEELENCQGAWLIKSCDGRYLKNKGSGKQIAVYQLKHSRDRDDRSLHWRLIKT